MPIIKSAKKRVRTATKAAIRNSKTKRLLKSTMKAFTAKPSSKTHSAAQSNIDKSVKKGVIHKNKAARMKKRMAATAKANSVKPAAAAKKSATKAKPAAKKVVKKAPAAKKPAAKKTTKK